MRLFPTPMLRVEPVADHNWRHVCARAGVLRSVLIQPNHDGSRSTLGLLSVILGGRLHTLISHPHGGGLDASAIADVLAYRLPAVRLAPGDEVLITMMGPAPSVVVVAEVGGP